MFENGGDEDDAPRGPSSDRYGIMEKLRRLQEGEDLDELLAEMDDEFPVVSESEEDDDLYGLTEVQKRTMNPERLFGEQEKRDKMAKDRKKDLTKMREKLMMGSTDNAMDNLCDLRNASANKIKKTKVHQLQKYLLYVHIEEHYSFRSIDHDILISLRSTSKVKTPNGLWKCLTKEKYQKE